MSHSEIELFSRSKTGATHCPGSNMRLGSGIAPVPEMLRQGVNVGIGVDGSASNDSTHLLAEVRQAMLLQRINPVANNRALLERAADTRAGDRLPPLPADATSLTARQSLELATRGGAAVLGRDDIGALAPGMSADFIAFDTSGIHFAGAQEDLVSALIFCHPQNVNLSVVNGRIIVQDGHLTTIEVESVIERHNQISRAMIRGE